LPRRGCRSISGATSLTLNYEIVQGLRPDGAFCFAMDSLYPPASQRRHSHSGKQAAMSTGASWTLSFPGWGSVGVYTGHPSWRAGSGWSGSETQSHSSPLTPLGSGTLALSVQAPRPERRYKDILSHHRISRHGRAHQPRLRLGDAAVVTVFSFLRIRLDRQLANLTAGQSRGRQTSLCTNQPRGNEYYGTKLGAVSGGYYPINWNFVPGHFHPRLRARPGRRSGSGARNCRSLPISGSGYKLDLDLAREPCRPRLVGRKHAAMQPREPPISLRHYGPVGGGGPAPPPTSPTPLSPGPILPGSRSLRCALGERRLHRHRSLHHRPITRREPRRGAPRGRGSQGCEAAWSQPHRGGPAGREARGPATCHRRT